MTLNPTKEEIRRTSERNARWLEKQRNLRWDGTQNHPLFAWAEGCILGFVRAHASKQGSASVTAFWELAHNLIDSQGYGLARAALLGLREKGEVILGREDPPIPTKESQDLRNWLILRAKRGGVTVREFYNVIGLPGNGKNDPSLIPES